MRKLAEESQQAARSIAALVEEIGAVTGRTVEVVGDGARRTADGAATVERARDAFTRISAAVGEVADHVRGIAAGALEGLVVQFRVEPEEAAAATAARR